MRLPLALLLLAVTATAQTFTINNDRVPGALLGFWPLATNPSNTTPDNSGNGNTGNLDGSPTLTNLIPSVWYPLPFAMRFNGSSQDVYLPLSLSSNFYFRGTSAWSVAYWIKPAANTTSFLVGVRKSLDGSMWGTYYVAGGKISHLYYATSDYVNGYHELDSAAGSVPLNVWTHIVLTRDKSNSIAGMKIYINGSNVSGTVVGNTGSPDAVFSVSLFGIGANPQTSHAYFNGALCGVQVYNRALTAAEAALLAGGYASTGRQRSQCQ